MLAKHLSDSAFQAQESAVCRVLKLLVYILILHWWECRISNMHSQCPSREPISTNKVSDEITLFSCQL